MATFIHGIAASENIDSSGECVSIKGMDISSLEKDGVFTYEHEIAKIPDKDGKQVELQVKLPSQVVGKILNARKIYGPEDCENDHQMRFWKRIETPYLYVMGELFDDYTDAARDLAGKFRYDADKKGQNERYVNNFSIEGGKIEVTKDRQVPRSVARKVTITVTPCNKAAIAEIVPIPKKDDLNSLFKTESTEIELLKAEDIEIINEEQDMKKAMPSGWKSSFSRSKLGKLSAVSSHGEHGQLSTSFNEQSGKYETKHNGIVSGLKGQKGIHDTGAQAAAHHRDYAHAVSGRTVIPKQMINSGSLAPKKPKNPLDLKKAMDAGSGMSAPGNAVQGAALAVESLEGKKKSRWLSRAEEEYDKWDKRDHFRKFMKEKMPHLAQGEIDSIGRTMALKKAMEAEKNLSKMVGNSTEKKEKKNG